MGWLYGRTVFFKELDTGHLTLLQYMGNTNWTQNIYFFFFKLFFGEAHEDGGGPVKDCEVSVIRVHYVKFPNHQ